MFTLDYIMSQICVIIASIFLALSFVTKNKKLILLFSSLCAGLYGLQYLILGAYTGAILNIVGIARNIWFFFNEKYNKEKDLVSILIIEGLTILLGVLTFENIYSILPIVANLTYNFGIWHKDNIYYKICAMIASICFISYNVVVLSILALVSESIMLIVEVITLIKLLKDRKYHILNNIEE